MTETQEFVKDWLEGKHPELVTQKEVAKFLDVSEELVSVACKAQRNENFDLKAYLRQNLKDIAEALVSKIKDGKGGTKGIELALKALGELVEKREDTLKLEYTPADHTRIARETIEGLRAEFIEHGGRCVVCGQSKLLSDKARLDTEPEHAED